MASLNKLHLIGNITKDPELRYLPKGTAVCKVGLAINRTWKSESGEKKEEVTFVDIDIFGKTAENVAQYCRKGKSIYVEGRLKLDTWEKDGKNHQKLGVIADSVQFLSGKGEGDSAARAEAPASASSAAGNPAPKQDADDVPF